MGLNVDDKKGFTQTFEGAITKVYKKVGNIHLQLHIFQPPDPKKVFKRPVIMFFPSGGWRREINVRQFEEQCKYFSSRGMIAIIAEFRVKTKHDVTPYDCISDAKTAIRWIRLNAKEFDVNPDKIVASGGSSGGHIAACTGMIKKFDEPYENKEISSVPNALVLFNPVINASQLASFKGSNYNAIDASPVHNVAKDLPPTIILHGTEDKNIPYRDVVRFAEEMKKVGNRCEVKLYEGKGHGFFNYKNNSQAYVETVTAVDKFLASLDYLQGSPTIS